ncbi:hypothetical protein JQ633_35015, partial [Bradyrhizobium tropiciagri]|uniref:SdrD B-like domain-containing protein n=1 Tax=Bradyrhizobium tropiciagri TaxID=312253 RepID=UPI001BA630E9
MATYKYNPATGTYTLSDDPFSVSTDQPDYSPGAIASITANGIEPGATVQFSVAHVDPGPDGLYGTADDKLTYDLSGTTEPWTATDGGFGDLDGVVNGVIKTAWNVGLDAAGQSFMLSATNSAAGLISTTAFTDTVTAGVTPTIDFTKIFGIAGDLPLNQPPNNVIVTAHPDEAYFTNDRTLTEVVSGSGNLESFVRISTNNLTEQGYNTSGSPLQFDENNSNQFTHNLPLAAIPISYFDLDGNGTPEAYYQFRLDINENNSATEQFLSLDKIEIWQSDTKDLHSGFVSGGTAADQTSYDPAGANPFGFTAAGVTGNYLAYNFDAGVANAANNWIGLEGSFYSGSGDSDMVLLVPITNFDTNLDWVYLYSAFGEQAGTSTIQYDADKDGVEEQTIANANWRNSGGYEEWAILSGVPASLSGSKWGDLDKDGTRDPGESGIAGWHIYLYNDTNGDGNLDTGEGLVASTVTDANGNFTFTNLPAVTIDGSGNPVGGKYIVLEEARAGWTQSFPGTDVVDTANPAGQSQFGYAVTLNPGENETGKDFGNFQLASVNGIKLLDANADGLKQAGENTPISGITINLYKDLNGDGTLQPDERDGVIDGDAQDTPFKTTTTAANGTWSFTGLDPGKYIVEEVLSGGYVTKDNVDVAITLTSGETHGVDEGTTFMNYKLASVNGIKLLDANADGLKQAGENTPISGITINLY